MRARAYTYACTEPFLQSNVGFLNPALHPAFTHGMCGYVSQVKEQHLGQAHTHERYGFETGKSVAEARGCKMKCLLLQCRHITVLADAQQRTLLP